MWEKMVRTELEQRQWDLIDPKQKDKHTAIRPHPKIEDFSQKYKDAVSEYQLKKIMYETAISNASTQSTSTAKSTRYQAPEEPEEPDPMDSDLMITNDEAVRYRLYADNWKVSYQKDKDYAADIVACKKAVTRRLGALAMPCFKAGMTPAEIYLALSIRFTPKESTMLMQAEEQYKIALTPPTHTGITDLRVWMSRWQVAVSNCYDYNAPCVSNLDKLCSELVKALKPTLEYVQNHMGVEANACPRPDKNIPTTYLDMANAIEDDWSKQGRYDVHVPQSRRGAFFAKTNADLSEQYGPGNEDTRPEWHQSDQNTRPDFWHESEQTSRPDFRHETGVGGRGSRDNGRGRGTTTRGRGNESPHGGRSLAHQHRNEKCYACESLRHNTDQCNWLDIAKREQRGWKLDKTLWGYVKVMKNRDTEEVKKVVRAQKAGIHKAVAEQYFKQLFSTV